MARALVVIGSGIAGLLAALTARRQGGGFARRFPTEELSLADAADGSAPIRETIRTLMWDHVGILRDAAGLAQARAALVAPLAAGPVAGLEASETANLPLVGWVMAEAALRREESRGAHYHLDFPEPRPAWRHRQLFVVRPRGTRRVSPLDLLSGASSEMAA
jgi:L-aspartate oxidase